MTPRTLLAISPVIFVLFLILFAVPSISSVVAAQEKLTITTVNTNKFVEGGKLVTASDSKLKIHSETWTDKSGNPIEIHIINYDDKGNLTDETWEIGTLVCHRGGHPKDNWDGKSYQFECGGDTGGGPLTELKTINQKIEQYEEKLAKAILDPSTPEYSKYVVDQPELRKTDTPEPKAKTETPPEQKAPPKTDKTSTGESGGNTASTDPTSLPPGYALNTNVVPGLDSWTVTTPYGGWRLNLPADVQPGEPFTGTIFLDPVGKTDADRAKNLSGLKAHRLQVGDQKIDFGKPYIPTYELYTVGLGRTVLRGGYRLLYDPPFYNIYLPVPRHFDLPTPPTEYRILTGGQQGGLFVIPGPFDGTVTDTDFVTINGERIPIISESPRSRVVWNTSKLLGDAKIEIGENGQTGTCPFHNVFVSVSATNLRLLRGQTATVTVTFTGLGRLNQDIPYDLVNHSPEVISMQGAQESQNRMIPYAMIANPDDSKGGTYTDHVTITGVAPGPFRITATVQWKETCNLPPNALHK